MQIVINIPDGYVGVIMSNQRMEGSAMDKLIRQAIIDGTPLPKGHGRLIDENELKKEAIRCEWSKQVYDMLDHKLSYMKPIIDADKESGNGEV